MVADHFSDIRSATVMCDEVLFEYLDTVEAGSGNCRQLLWQITGNGDRRYRGLHRVALLQSTRLAAG